MSVSVAAGQSVVVVAQSLSGIGHAYTLTFNYLSSGCYDLFFMDDYNRSRLWLNSTSGGYQMDVLSGPTAGSYTGTASLIKKNGTIMIPYVNGTGQALSGSFAPSTGTAFFNLRLAGGQQAYLIDKNTTGSLPL